MKKLSFITLFGLFILSGCYKEEQNCLETKTCWTITHSFSICNVKSGIYNFQNIRSDTSYSLVNECKVDRYIKSAAEAEKRLYDATDGVGRAFIDMKPIECGCEE
jgi:hypothetical protein